MAVFQPGEETAQGAKAMIDDGMFQTISKTGRCARAARHELAVRGTSIGVRALHLSAHSLDIRMFGRGAHGSMPESSIDPCSYGRRDRNAA